MNMAVTTITITRKKHFAAILVCMFLALLAVNFLVPANVWADDRLEIGLHHLILREVDGKLEVREIITLINKETEPVVIDASLPAEDQFTFRVKLPYGTEEVFFPEGIEIGNEVKFTDTGVSYLKPIEPGETTLDFMYTVAAHNGTQYLLDKEISYPTGELYFITAEQIGLAGPKITYLGSNDISGKVFNQYAWEQPAVGDQVMILAGTDVAVDGKTGAGGSNLDRGYRASFHSAGHIRFWNTSPFSRMEPHLFLVVLFGVASTGTYFYIKGRRKEVEKEDEEHLEEIKFQRLLSQQAELMAMLAETEQKYQAAELSQEEYEKLYQSNKEKLAKVKLKLKMLST